MGSIVSLPSGGGSTAPEDGGSGSVESIALVALADNIQEGFNSAQISWSNIDWSLFPARAGFPDYTVTHSLDSVTVFASISAVEPPEYEEALDADGNTIKDEDGNVVFEKDAYGNNIRIIDYANDLFLAWGGTDGNDHLRSKNFLFPDGNGEQVKVTGALMGFSGDDVLYSENIYIPMLMGGSGDDSYILEGGGFSQIVEYGNDANDEVISYSNTWALAGEIDGQHLFLSNSAQTDVVVIWDYKVEEAKVESFWFDLDNNGLNEHYTFDGFISEVQSDGFWVGSLSSEELGISRITLEELAQTVSEAVLLSSQIENMRIADGDVALSVARLYQAAFDREPDIGGLNHWIDAWETTHASLGEIASSFYTSNEFNLTYGGLSDDEFITQLYSNVLDREPDTGGFDFWTDVLGESHETRAEVMLGFSNSLENKVNTELQLSGLTEDTPGEWIL